MRQKGFATLEVILMVTVIGILAAIAVPRFNAVTTAANTAKIQADLTTIDTAISVYYMEHGSYPTSLSDLSDYLRGVDSSTDTLKPPSGQCYLGGETKSVPSTSYTIDTVDSESRAICGSGNTAEKFYLPKKTSD